MPKQGTAQAAERRRLTLTERQEAAELLATLFGITEDDPLIDMPMIAKLAGVAPGTPGAWQQRTRVGKERVPFPAPDDDRYHDKPQWRAVSTIIEGFLAPSDRWPRGRVARESTRIERPATRVPRTNTERTGVSGLRRVDAELARGLERLRLDDGKVRTVGGWRRRLNAELARPAP